MRLERVIAKDSRRATEQVIEQFGADALIISNQKVNGMTEIVVAVDIDTEPLDAAPINRDLSSGRQGSEGVASSTPGLADTSTGRAEPVLSSLPRTPADREPGLNTWTAERFGKVLQQSFTGNRDTVTSPAQDDHPLSASASRTVAAAAPAVPGWLAARPSPTQTVEGPIRNAPSADDAREEHLRARELVDMVREELASMRREIALSRQIGAHASSRRLAPEVQPIADALEEAGAPLALRTLLLDQIAHCTGLSEALATIRATLCESIQIQSQRGRLEGVNVIAGPSGSGKTQMACRLAARHAASRGAGSVALISFADSRIGAWTQLQMLAARTGIECFRVSDAALLGALLDELASRELILVDTSSSGWKESLSAIADCAPSARFHLLLPADASAATVHRHQCGDAWQWTSLMLTKLDESTQPWAVIQALCNQSFALSVASNNPAPESGPIEIDPAALIGSALSHCPGLVESLTPPPPRSRRSAPRKSAKEVRHAA